MSCVTKYRTFSSGWGWIVNKVEKAVAVAKLIEENAKLRAFVEATTKDTEKSEFSPWDYHPTWRALEAQQLLKELDG